MTYLLDYHFENKQQARAEPMVSKSAGGELFAHVTSFTIDGKDMEDR